MKEKMGIVKLSKKSASEVKAGLTLKMCAFEAVAAVSASCPCGTSPNCGDCGMCYHDCAKYAATPVDITPIKI